MAGTDQLPVRVKRWADPLQGAKPFLIVIGLLGLSFPSGALSEEPSKEPASSGFSFSCANTTQNPCQKLVPKSSDDRVRIEASSVAWSDRFQMALVVSDNYNDLRETREPGFVIGYFDPEQEGPELAVLPLLTDGQALDLNLYDLEGVVSVSDRLYVIGSLALHGKDPRRDRWERHQFVRMDLSVSDGRLAADSVVHVSPAWPDFREWVLEASGHTWSERETIGRAEGDGLNVEALSITPDGNILIGLRGPATVDGHAIALEVVLPDSPDIDPVLKMVHKLPELQHELANEQTARTLRAIAPNPSSGGSYYVLLGPLGYEKERVFLALWDSLHGELSRATALPEGFVGEGITALPDGSLLVVDDLDSMVLIARER